MLLYHALAVSHMEVQLSELTLQGHVLVNPFVDVQLLPSSPRFSEWREITSASASPTARQQQQQQQHSLAGFNSLRAGKPTLRAQLAGNFGTRSNSQRGSGHKRGKEKRGAADSPVTEQLQQQVNSSICTRYSAKR